MVTNDIINIDNNNMIKFYDTTEKIIFLDKIASRIYGYDWYGNMGINN